MHEQGIIDMQTEQQLSKQCYFSIVLQPTTISGHVQHTHFIEYLLADSTPNFEQQITEWTPFLQTKLTELVAKTDYTYQTVLYCEYTFYTSCTHTPNCSSPYLKFHSFIVHSNHLGLIINT